MAAGSQPHPTQRIAEVIENHTPSGAEGMVNCWCEQRFDTFRAHSLHVAAAVVDALQLTEQRRKLAAAVPIQSRLVGPWGETR